MLTCEVKQPRLRSCIYDLHAEANKFVRYRVIVHVTPKIDTAIIIHSQVGIELGLVIFLRQRVEIRLLYGKEKFFTSLWTLLHTLLVVFLHFFDNIGINVPLVSETNVPPSAERNVPLVSD